MMKLLFSKKFIRQYHKLPSQLQKITDKQLDVFLSNPHHPSLNVKKMNDPRNIWEGRISESYRFTFQIQGDTYFLRKIGSHDILKKP